MANDLRGSIPKIFLPPSWPKCGSCESVQFFRANTLKSIRGGKLLCRVQRIYAILIRRNLPESSSSPDCICVDDLMVDAVVND